jgi:hypothetical protein
MSRKLMPASVYRGWGCGTIVAPSSGRRGLQRELTGRWSLEQELEGGGARRERHEVLDRRPGGHREEALHLTADAIEIRLV